MTARTLAQFTTFRVGGPAEQVVTPSTRDELVDTVLSLWGSGQEPLVVGGGSNLLVSDDGYQGPLVRVRTTGIQRFTSRDGSRVRLIVEAGESWDDLVAHTVANGWCGIEALSGIPGSVGAAPIQNIGAYGQELVSSLAAVWLLDRERGEVLRVPPADLALGYRTSALKRHGGAEPERDGVVVAVEIELVDAHGTSAPIAYDQLAFALGVDLGERMSVAQVRKTVLALRASKGMVLDADDRDTWSAGSFFTNPIVSESFARTLPADAPRWPVDEADDDREIVIPLERYEGNLPAAQPVESRVKLSAAWLIERAGVRRGFALPGGRARVSTKHTLALTNAGGATADDIAALARFVQSRVSAEFGVVLQPEPVLVGVEL
ncbi:UDP-N-acetylmuramate dehydrogenase [Okibacterium endophyticum]